MPLVVDVKVIVFRNNTLLMHTLLSCILSLVILIRKGWLRVPFKLQDEE